MLEGGVPNIRDVLCGEAEDGGDEVLSYENAPNGPPVLGGLPKQQADALHGHLHHLGRVGQGTYLNKLLLLDGLDGCCKERGGGVSEKV